MTKQAYPNSALTDICKKLIDDWDLTLDQIAALAKDIPGERKAIDEKRSEPQDDDSDYHTPDASGYSRADEEWFFDMDGKP